MVRPDIRAHVRLRKATEDDIKSLLIWKGIRTIGVHNRVKLRFQCTLRTAFAKRKFPRPSESECFQLGDFVVTGV